MSQRTIICLLVFFLSISCKYPWLIPGGTLETFANHKEDGFLFIQHYHDFKYPNDKLRFVINSKIINKQENGMGSIESWKIETESGKKFEYILQVAYFVGGGRGSGTSVRYNIVTSKTI